MPRSCPASSQSAVVSSIHPVFENVVRAILSRDLPDLTVDTVLPIPSTRPQRLYYAQASNGKALLAAFPPPSTCKLLRSETTALRSEAAVVQWVRETVSARPPDDDGNHAIIPQQYSPATERTLADLMPTLVSHCHNAEDPRLLYNVFEPVRGTLIAQLSSPPAPSERQQVQRQAGRFLRRLCALTSPSGDFGPVESIVSISTSPAPRASSMPVSVSDHRQSMFETDRGMPKNSSRSWSEAFHLMLEDILRDAEDMAVMLAYSAIRQHFRQIGHLLDSVKTPRLVVVRGMTDENMVVSRAADRASTLESLASGRAAISSDQGPPARTDKASQDSDDDAAAGYVVTGLCDWSGCVFGDPLFASMFGHDAPPAFLRGFNGTGATREPEGDGVLWDESVIEDAEHAETRMLLYGVFHAVASIVSEIYRPRCNSTARELEARKRLAEMLIRLQEADDGMMKKRWALPEGAEPPAKKARLDEDKVVKNEEAPREFLSIEF